MATLRLLIVEDDPSDAELVVRELKKSGFDPVFRTVNTREGFTNGLEDRPDIIIYDYNLPRFSSAEALQLTQQSGLVIPFIIVSNAIGDEEAVALMRAGAADYLLKDRLGRLGEAVRHALEQRRLREEHAAARESIVTLNAELELRIAARTAELKVANHALEGELGQRRRAEEALLRLNGELEERVRERTRDLQALASELTLAEQRERKRLASELHDYLAQMLALGRMKTAQLRSKVASDSSAVAQLVCEIDDLLQKAGEYTRTLMAKLNPPVLDDMGLPAALAWLAEQMPLHNLMVEVSLAQDQVPLPEDQAVLLFQSVRELLINIAKHAGTDRAAVALRVDERNQLCIEVRDSGCGFDPAVADTQTGNAHFGLFSVRERMQAMGGRLDVKSERGQGTTATLVLPLGRSAETNVLSPELGTSDTVTQTSTLPNGSALSPQHSALQQKDAAIRVLLVDDHVMVRQGFKALLDGFGNVSVVGEAGDGQEAVAMAATLQPDLVLMDINMPWMDGIEATKRITQQWPETPVIGLSVDNQPQTVQAMKTAGAALLVSKDAAAEHLHDVIVAVGGNHRPAGSVGQEQLS